MKKVQYGLGSKIMYGLGDIFGGGAFLLISLLFLNYLTDVELINPALAGIIIMSGKFIDAITDPLMGYLSDRTKSKFGRRRIYFLVGMLPILITFSLLWYSFNISGIYSKFIYYFIMYALFSVAFTIVMIPYNSLLPEMVKDFNERTSFTSVRMCFSVFSAILAGVVPSIIVSGFDNVKVGYLVMGIVFAIIYSIPWIFVFFGTWEDKDQNLKNDVHFFKELKFVFKNRLLRVHISIFITAQAAVDFLTTVFIYYLAACLNRQKEFSLILGTLLIMQLISMPIHAKVSKKYGKTAPLKIGLIIWIVSLISSIFITSASPKFIIYVIAAFFGIGTSASTLVPWSILPEVADVDELITGRRREGIYSGIVTFIRKAANGIAIGLIGVLLQIIGYVKPAVAGEVIVQSDSVILGIKLLFSVAPIIFIIMALIFQRAYNLTKEKHEIIMDEINRIKIEGNFTGDSKTIKVCEEITGLKYTEIQVLRRNFQELENKTLV